MGDGDLDERGRTGLNAGERWLESLSEDVCDLMRLGTS
jgi:hypothetical protein